MNSLNFSAFWLGWNRVEIFQTSIPTSDQDDPEREAFQGRIQQLASHKREFSRVSLRHRLLLY